MVESIKLLDVAEQNAEEIAEHWAMEVQKNKRTTHYQSIKKEKLKIYAVDFTIICEIYWFLMIDLKIPKKYFTKI